MSSFLDIFILLVAFACSMGLTVLVHKVLLTRKVLDQPNERSSHTIPTPRGGGWALLGVLVPGMLLACFFQHGELKSLWIIAGVFLLAFVSWQDDKKGISASFRLSLHILAAFIGTFALDAHATLFGDLLPFWLDRLLMIISWAWFINLYNFMDGIDGITCVETITLASGACLLFTASNIHAPFADIMTLLLVGACLGFLALNWHPAKIFMGDIGSVPLGFLTGFLLLIIATHGHLIVALILPLYYLSDSGITITRRALRGERIWQAHRQHFYQKAALSVGRHDKVVFWIALANIALIASALFAIPHPFVGVIAAIMITACLLAKMSFSLVK